MTEIEEPVPHDINGHEAILRCAVFHGWKPV
jgi:hypothetical protein